MPDAVFCVLLKPSHTMRSVIADVPPVCQKRRPFGSLIVNDHAVILPFVEPFNLINKSSSTPSLSGLKYVGVVRTLSSGGTAEHTNGDDEAETLRPFRYTMPSFPIKVPSPAFPALSKPSHIIDAGRLAPFFDDQLRTAFPSSLHTSKFHDEIASLTDVRISKR